MSEDVPQCDVAPQQHEKGVCPVKPEYIRIAPVDARVSLDTDGKTRGMYKGAERLHTESVAGTLRPTFEGESNFLHGDVLNKVKFAIRTAANVKRSRDEEKKSEVPLAPTITEAPVTDGSAPRPPGEDEIAQAERRDERKRSAAEEVENHLTTAEMRREHLGMRDSMFREKVILAPLTTVGNLPYRRICKEFGADVTLSEMALVYNLNHTQKSEWSLLRRHSSEGLFGLQIAVSRPADAMIFAKAIQASEFSYDYIDINCGCPVDKLVQSGCGCGLWEKKSRLREVVQLLTKYQAKPVTIKCRIGADENNPSLHNQIGEYEGWGASAVTIHGRSRRQRYTKLANWNYINQCASLTALPVVGNGDIMSIEDYEQHRTECPNVSSVMIGRGALIKPWIFEEIKERKTMDISSSERFEILKKFCGYGLAHWGADDKGVLSTRRFLCEALSFMCRYVPVGLLERLPQRINERPPLYEGRDDLETLLASESVMDWIKISEMLLGPAGDKFKFTPKHKSNAYSAGVQGPATAAVADDEG